MAGGRPSKYESHVKPKLNTIKAWARNGLTDIQMANNLGIAKDTFIEYKKQYSDLADAVKHNKDDADLEVENALFKSAQGFYYTTQEVTKQGDIIIVEKYQPPSNTAQIFWLKNRKPKDWRDKQEVSHDGTMNINNPFDKLTTEELKKLINNE